MTLGAVEIENLAAFRTQLRRAEGATVRDLSSALRAAGKPIVDRTRAVTPTLSGFLAKSYAVSVRGTTGSIGNKAPYAGGAEWGRHGRWKGFDRYGQAGSRFAARVVDERSDEIAAAVLDGLEDVVTIYGWAV